MVDCSIFYDALVRHNIKFFTGVPDTVLKSVCAYISDHAPAEKHVVSANEGGAVALACGYHLATGNVGLVYMQNSGQGNAINPLISLADPEVYSIPMLLLIGWRGEPGKHDEPQHIKQGQVTLKLFETIEIPYKILPEDNKPALDCLQKIIDELKKNKAPVALIVKKGTFKPYELKKSSDLAQEITREKAIETVADSLGESDIVVSSTGKISRELYEYRNRLSGNHNCDFLTVGSMGHCSQIAMGVALGKPERQVYCFDGDGAVLMHMGSLAIIGSEKIKNLKHIVFNNCCHDSVGGQPTAALSVSITGIAKECGYKTVLRAKTVDEINDKMKAMKSSEGPSLLEIIVKKGAREDLGRPKISPEKNKENFMEFLSK